MSSARRPPAKYVMKASFLWNTGAMLSFDECAPKRTPRSQ